MEEIIPVYKPVGFSTYDLIRIFKARKNFQGKIGHGGTLDPFACGLVLLLLGEATKKFEEIRKWEKTYLAGLRFGVDSLSGDIEGPLEEKKCSKKPGRAPIEKELKNFIGLIKQKVPAFSAAKHKGQPLYKLARRGEFVFKEKEVEIKKVELISYKWPFLVLRITVLGGAYIRQIALDLGEKLNCPAALFFLERERIGDFKKKDALSMI